MAETYDSVLVKQCKTQFNGRSWDGGNSCNADDTAAIAVRTILEMAGEVDLLAATDEARAERVAMVKAIRPVFEAGAPINFRRTALVNMGIAPKVDTTKQDVTRPV